MAALKLMVGAAALALAAAAPAAPGDPGRDKVAAAVKSAHSANVVKLREWIALPTIAAENKNVAEGAAYMVRLAREAGFADVRTVPTSGVPGVFGTIDVGAPVTLGVYFMYDVKQYDPAEWSSPPLEGRIVDRPGEGRAMVGRGAVNQKGPETAFLAAVRAFKDAGVKLPVNLVLVAEGEEEIGSPNFHQIVADPAVFAALKKSAGVFIPFNAQNPDGSASVNLGAKGVVEWWSAARRPTATPRPTPIRRAMRGSRTRRGGWSKRSTHWSRTTATRRRSTAGSNA
jgi:acetylornithine deacetylase/succinyl-diaminopimelate desuccinylase-like protein